ncbi:MAG TPA: hypothetical protein DCR40_08725 [Prolixibacteraceae bacterium]|nr:hypothetical protein [Prolixibacteraceae bacterium]
MSIIEYNAFLFEAKIQILRSMFHFSGIKSIFLPQLGKDHQISKETFNIIMKLLFTSGTII